MTAGNEVDQELSEKDRAVLQTLLETWDLSLPGDLSYQDVIDLCKKMNLAVPKHMTDMLASYESS